MEIIQTIFGTIYTLLAQSTTVWPVVLLVLGLFFLMQPNKGYRQYVKYTLLTALALGLVLFLILAAGNIYGANAIPYQQGGVGVYYIVLLVWFIPTIRSVGASRK